MKSKKLISAILAAASIAGGVVGAQAETLDSLTARVDKQDIKIVDLQTTVGIGTSLTNGAGDLSAGVNENTKAIKTKADALETTKNFAKVQEQLDTQNEKNGAQDVSIKAHTAAIKANKDAIKTKADALETTKNFTKVQEQLDTQNDKNKAQDVSIKANGAAIKANKDAIDANAAAIKANKAEADATNTYFNSRIENNTANIDKNKVAIENEAKDRKDADVKLNAKIDSNAAKVQEQLDAQDNKNKAQDESIKANGAAIKANKDAIKANADAIKANKAEADATNTYFNSRIENNTANIDKNKVAIENEAKDRKDADVKLQENINAEATARKDADKKLQDNIDAEATARKDADTKLQNNIDNEAATRIAGDNVLNSRINQVESDANKGIAKASALAALHPLDYDPDNKFDIAAAGGFYKGENAFALGAFYRPNRNVMLSMGTTLTGGDNAYNVGVTFKIGKSGKHTEAGLTTADLYAMIGTMQEKMDQQQKKIEELEAKQAK